MEKRVAHCDLSVVRRLVEDGKFRVTAVAVEGADELGTDALGIRETVLLLTPRDFYKSMTSYRNHAVWQDVYRPSTRFGDVYLKLTVVDDVLVVSFKEL